MAAFGVAIWTLPRLLKTELVGGRFAVLGAMLWNAGLIAGLGGIAAGFTDGLEWLEIPWQVDILIVIGGALRSEEHTSELQSLMRISYAVFCLNKKKDTRHN